MKIEVPGSHTGPYVPVYPVNRFLISGSLCRLVTGL